MKDIQNLNTQICLLNKNSDDLDNSLRNKNCQNIKIINEFNDAKSLNNDLANELKNKECALMQIQKELCLANETLSRLEKDLDNLNISHNRNKEQIACFNSNYVKENSLNNQLTNDNTKLNNAINDRNVTIQKLNSENNALKCDNTNTNRDNKFLNSKIEAYKKHILTLTNQNEKLSAELEAIISRDSQLLFTLGRDSHLRAVQQENKNVINSSLDCLQAYTQCKNYNGNAGYSPKSNYGVNVNRSSSLHNSRIDVGDGSGEEQQYSGGEDGQYSGGEEEMQYSGGEEGYGQSSGDENQ
jgi:chromosome segregation ATPase